MFAALRYTCRTVRSSKLNVKKIRTSDIGRSFKTKTFSELVRSYLVLTICKFPVFVAHSESLAEFSYSLLGQYITNKILKISFFAQFVGGERADELSPVVSSLQSTGIKGIYSFAAEGGIRTTSSSTQYKYDHFREFKLSIEMASLNSGSLIAIKPTALFDVEILAKLSANINKNLSLLNLLFSPNHISFQQILGSQRQLCSDLSDKEAELALESYRFINSLSQIAKEKHVSILVDAEQTSIQPAIDLICLSLMSEHNTASPVVVNTYQMYLQRSPKRLEADISRAKRFGYVFAAKLVRGAYMKFEFENAEKTGTAVPYWPSLAKTHDAYDGAVGLCLTELSQGLHAYLMLATHNQSSIEKAMSLMRELKMSSESVSFTQLYGMKDHITFALGTHGYRAYKLIPYGSVKSLIPYLSRRALENSAILSGVDVEQSYYLREIRRRMSFL